MMFPILWEQHQFSSLLPPSLHIHATFHSQERLVTPVLRTSSAGSKEALSSSSYPPIFQQTSCYNLYFLNHLIFTCPWTHYWRINNMDLHPDSQHNKEATQHLLDYRATELSSQWEQFDQTLSSVSPYPSSSSIKFLKETAHKDSMSNQPSMTRAATVLWPLLHHSCLLTALHYLYKAYQPWAAPTILRQIILKSLGAGHTPSSAFLHCCLALSHTAQLGLVLFPWPEEQTLLQPPSVCCLDQTALLSAVCALVLESFILEI